jgi:hypothetical protein
MKTKFVMFVIRKLQGPNRMAFQQHSSPGLFSGLVETAREQGNTLIALEDRDPIWTRMTHLFKDAPLSRKKQCRLFRKNCIGDEKTTLIFISRTRWGGTDEKID